MTAWPSGWLPQARKFAQSSFESHCSAMSVNWNRSMYQDFSRWGRPASTNAMGLPTDRATSRSTRSGAKAAVAQASAAPQSCPTTAARSTPTASSTAEHVARQEQQVVLVDLVGLVRLAVPAQVGHDHLVPGGGERRHLVAPHPTGVGEAVQQDHGRALSRHLVVDADSVRRPPRMGSPGSGGGAGAVRRRAARAARRGWARGWGRRANRCRPRGCGRRSRGRPAPGRAGEQRHEPHAHPHEVGVAGDAVEHRHGELVAVVGRRLGARDGRLHLGHPLAVHVDRRPVPGLHRRERGRVERLRQARRVVDGRRAQGVAQRQAVHQADGRAPTHRRVGARPGVTDEQQPGGHRLVVDHEAAVPVLDLRERHDVVLDRLAVEPVGDHRVAREHAVPGVEVADRPQGGVVARGDQRDAPGAVVGGERQRRDGVVVLQRRAEGRRCRAVGGAEVAAVVGEPEVVDLVVGRGGADGLEPPEARGPPAGHVDHEVGGQLGAVLGVHAGDVGDPAGAWLRRAGRPRPRRGARRAPRPGRRWPPPPRPRAGGR